MQPIATILIFSTVIWYIVDRIKKSFDEAQKVNWSKWATIISAAALSTACVLCFNLDLISALSIVQETSLMGQILTILILMSGSSGVSEIISAIKVKTDVK